MTTETTLTTQQVADHLVELCREGKFGIAQDELYAEHAESIEPEHAEGLQSVKGIDAIRKKGQQFQEMVEETHDVSITNPIVAGNYISLGLTLEATFKGRGRSKMEELAVYEVKDGKIVKEQFFY
ncbi:nuclear transport factor 2 family protein [Chitinophagaceae bacterium LB-8]|uniref:Nuclear transport factor 2 family protein n=1 Tax=Paraflavisolibacter caeni TaxID=2982496 RepID=A0A9X2Y0M7_9BACT|nr:nuclear transport factor 2 family protein [Paraflavisolibacter caeni]MCU7550908.1 nuclear transport factor 2 family protein [Paraflavisolibacter caeni]